MTLFKTATAIKSEMYGVIKELLVGAGWRNVSSNPDTEFDILTSNGEAGDKELVFQMRNYQASAVNDVQTTDYSHAGIRLIGGYAPSLTAGEKGVISRTSETWKSLPLAPVSVSVNSLNKDTPVTYRYSVNKNRLILVIEYPPAVNTYPVTIYIGIPDEVYCSEPASRGLLYAVSSSAYSAQSLSITDNAGELASLPSSKSLGMLCQLAPKNPNSAGNFTLSEIFYGDNSEGVRGKLTGIFALPTQNVANGDIIVQGNQEYLVVVNGSSTNDAFPSKAIALPLAPVNG